MVFIPCWYSGVWGDNMPMSDTEQLELLKLLEEQQVYAARTRLIDFVTYTMPTYQVNWHHDRYAAALDRFARGEIRKLMVFMPPQNGKSLLCSVNLPAKLLGDNPNFKVAIASYNTTFAAKWGRDVQRIIEDPKYQQLYPDTKLPNRGAGYIRTTEEFEILHKKGSFIAVGVGGGLTGRAVDIGIIDDPYKDAQDAWSPTVRANVQDWYDSVFRTRLHNDSQQLITLTRWHPDDLAGTILKREPGKWHQVIFPAVKLGPPNTEDPRLEGEALWPSRHSLERLLEIKQQNQVIFLSMYQQDPKPAEGLLFPVESLNRFTLADIQTEGDYYKTFVGVIDIADKGTDYYCLLVAVLFESRIYIIDCIFTQAPITVTEPLTIEMLKRYKVRKCRVESNAGGEIYCNNLKRELWKARSITQIQPSFTTTNKETRILLSSGAVKEHVWFRSDYALNSDYAKFMDNLTGYVIMGKNEHDDAADGATMLIEMLSESGLRYRAGMR
jgi:predicted phage terminase large subunit-like protein